MKTAIAIILALAATPAAAQPSIYNCGPGGYRLVFDGDKNTIRLNNRVFFMAPDQLKGRGMPIPATDKDGVTATFSYATQGGASFEVAKPKLNLDCNLKRRTTHLHPGFLRLNFAT